MGVVYAAYDPELDRKVALKLLQPRADGRDDSRGQAWLLREAQAMARLAHPNVIAVHDVGTLGGDRVFVAMELVDGGTLRAWLRASKRTWREVVAVCAPPAPASPPRTPPGSCTATSSRTTCSSARTAARA